MVALRLVDVVTTVLLVGGLALTVAQPAGAIAKAALPAGLLLLMATPVARLVTAITQEARAREWAYAGLGVLVLALLACSIAISVAG
ncbi:MAG: DUF1634 domain-containing protein [Vicinamibacterales bacterium]